MKLLRFVVLSSLSALVAAGCVEGPLLSGKLVPFTLRLKLLKAVPVAVFVIATLLILRGMELGIPFVSPVITSNSPDCCHN